MKIFPVKLLSPYDKIKNLINIMAKPEQLKLHNTITNQTDVVIKKGRSVCHMLSE